MCRLQAELKSKKAAESFSASIEKFNRTGGDFEQKMSESAQVCTLPGFWFFQIPEKPPFFLRSAVYKIEALSRGLSLKRLF